MNKFLPLLSPARGFAFALIGLATFKCLPPALAEGWIKIGDSDHQRCALYVMPTDFSGRYRNYKSKFDGTGCPAFLSGIMTERADCQRWTYQDWNEKYSSWRDPVTVYPNTMGDRGMKLICD